MNYISCPVNKIALSTGKNKTAILSAYTTISYLQLDELIQHTSRYLILSGVRKRAKVGLLLPNGIDFIVCYFALLRIVAVSCLLSLRSPLQLIEQKLAALNCSHLISSKNNSSKFQNIKLVKIDSQINQLEFVKNLRLKRFQYGLSKTSNIMFTSGSSGEPKAVVHSIENHYYSALGSNRHIPLGRDDHWMLSLPIYHVAGLSIIWRAFMAGASVCVPDEEYDLIENIKKLKPTHISLVMTQLIQCMKNRSCRKCLAGMKGILIGGSAVNRKVVEEAVKDKLPIYLSYGLTEMSSQVATSRKLRASDDFGSIRILPYRRIRIDRKQHVLVSGRTLFKGYYANGRIKKSLDKHGWFKTGDLGKFSKGNRLEILGRQDNMFISGGENIYPEQIERLIMQFGDIEQAAVIPRTDQVYGQRPVAFLKVTSGRKFDRIKLIQYLTLYVEKFKIPDEFYHWPAIDNQIVSKINRLELKSLIESSSPKLSKII